MSLTDRDTQRSGWCSTCRKPAWDTPDGYTGCCQAELGLDKPCAEPDCPGLAEWADGACSAHTSDPESFDDRPDFDADEGREP